MLADLKLSEERVVFLIVVTEKRDRAWIVADSLRESDDLSRQRFGPQVSSHLCYQARKLAFQARKVSPSSNYVASQLDGRSRLGKSFPLKKVCNFVGRVIGIDEATALLAKPDSILGCPSPVGGKVWVEAWASLGSSSDVCRHA
jgi:hypothetical protein